MKRLSRVESQARTQERLLDAAGKVFAREGFDAASVAELAGAAGYSRGAFYSNFESKDELFLALLERQLKRESEALTEIIGRPEPANQRLLALQEFFARSGQDRDWCLLTIEFQLYAVRNPSLRGRLVALYRERNRGLIKMIERVFNELGRPVPTTPAHLAAALIAMSEGLALRQLVEPEHFSARDAESTLSFFFERCVATPRSGH
jgi:AcrR family transcriptional regulator